MESAITASLVRSGAILLDAELKAAPTEEYGEKCRGSPSEGARLLMMGAVSPALFRPHRCQQFRGLIVQHRPHPGPRYTYQFPISPNIGNGGQIG